MIINIADYQDVCTACRERDCENCIIILEEELKTFIAINSSGFEIGWDEFWNSDEWCDEYIEWAGLE